MKKPFLLLTLVVATSCVNISLAQTIIECLGFGGTGNDSGNGMVQTADSGFVIAGQTASFGASGTDICLSKVDVNGNLQWTRVIRGGKDDGAWSLEKTYDGGFVLGGFSNTVSGFDEDFYVAKFDSSWNMQWDKTVGTSEFEYCYSVDQTFDRGYILSGRYNTINNSVFDFYIVKLDSVGSLQWSKMIGGTGEEIVYGMEQTSDSGYVLAGYTTSFGAGGADVYIVKLDSAGNEEWAEAIGGTSDEYAQSIIQTSDGGYAIAGYTKSFGAGNEDYYVIKLDAQGNLLWTKTIGAADHDYGRCIQQTSDDGYIVGGSSSSFMALTAANYLVKLDASGNLEWSACAGETGSQLCNSITETFDGGYMVGGTVQPVNNITSDFMLTKFDAVGNSCCSALCSATVGNGGSLTTGAVISTVTSTVHDASFPDTLVEGTMNAYCLATSSREIQVHHSLIVAPNPAVDHFTVSFERGMPKGILHLYNAMGEIVFEKEISQESSFNISIENFPEGIYLMKLIGKMPDGSEMNHSEKLIIQ